LGGDRTCSLSPPNGTRLEPARARRPAQDRGLPAPTDANPQTAFYTFSVGERAIRLRPERVEVVRDRGVFVKPAGCSWRFRHLYDAVGGYVGYGWNRRLKQQPGRVTPGLFRRALSAGCAHKTFTSVSKANA